MMPADDLSHLRVPPHDIAAEQAVLGGVMLAGVNALHRVSGMLEERDFYRRDHQLIWRGISALSEKKRPIDAVTVGDWFQSHGLVDQVAGGAYLVELAANTPSAANIRAYAEIVAEKALRRRVIEFGTEVVNAGFEQTGDTDEIVANAQNGVIALTPKQAGGLSRNSESLSDWFEDLVRRSEQDGRITGLPTPWAEVNKRTHGLQKGELTLIAARPSMGKSIMALNQALFTAMRGQRVALFSLEMNKRQVNRRCIASLQSIPHDWLLSPYDKDEQGNDLDYWPHVTRAVSEIKQANLYVDDTADLSIAQLMARARSLHIREPIDLLVVDHIHDFKINAKEARFEYGRVAQGIKTLAKEFDCPAIGVAQLNRDVGKRQDKRPVMSDLRESGELEQKGDLILFLHREDYYDKSSYMRGAVELIVAKGRDIETGENILLRNDYAHMALRDWEGPTPAAPVQQNTVNKSGGWGRQRDSQ